MNLFIAEVARQQVLLEGLTQELGDVPNIESAHQVEPMDFDRPDADIQRSRRSHDWYGPARPIGGSRVGGA